MNGIAESFVVAAATVVVAFISDSATDAISSLCVACGFVFAVRTRLGLFASPLLLFLFSSLVSVAVAVIAVLSPIGTACTVMFTAAAVEGCAAAKWNGGGRLAGWRRLETPRDTSTA